MKKLTNSWRFKNEGEWFKKLYNLYSKTLFKTWKFLIKKSRRADFWKIIKMFLLPISADGGVFLSSNCFHYRISCAHKLLSLLWDQCEWCSWDECFWRPNEMKGQEPNTRRTEWYVNASFIESTVFCYDVIE